MRLPLPHLRPHRRLYTTTTPFADLVKSAVPLQIYISQSTSPLLNLSLEHHLFNTTHSLSTTLLLYTNTPSVILGRNQNPWTETNHPLLLASGIPLHRRRSGGGTVYHDLGNVNYSITTPTSRFSRDRGAELMARVLRSLGVARAAVNGRHDIVLLPRDEKAVRLDQKNIPGALKMSGSAYKLTRLRSYHHGTMLLNSDLGEIGKYLKSSVGGVIEAKGVASVASAVVNSGVQREAFVDAAVREFEREYWRDYESAGRALVCEIGEQEALQHDGVKKEWTETGNMEWVYGQTPKFTVFLPGMGPRSVGVEKGVVTETHLEEIRGKRFGGQMLMEALVKNIWRRENRQAEWSEVEWTERLIGGKEWGLL